MGCAQAPEMSPAQARQALLSYVQLPDTGLAPTPAETYPSGLNGHTKYLFYGDYTGNRALRGGLNRIDAASGEKDIKYVSTSTWDGNAADAPALLPTSQILQSAQAFVAQHFPGYVPGMFQNSCNGTAASPNDAEYTINFYSLAPSGAWRPLHCLVNVEDDTGHVSSYTEQAIPVTIPTVPSITRDQAIQSGQNWIFQNVTADPVAGELETDIGGRPPVQLEVSVDPLLQQTLVYNIMYRRCPLTVDAQNGSVINVDGWMGGTSSKLPPHLPEDLRESLWEVTPRPKVDFGLSHRAVSAAGQIYLWSGQLKLLGISARPRGLGLELRKGSRSVKLAGVSRTPGKVNTAWKRGKELYVPVAALDSLKTGVTIDKPAQSVVLNLPATIPARVVRH